MYTHARACTRAHTHTALHESYPTDYVVYIFCLLLIFCLPDLSCAECSVLKSPISNGLCLSSCISRFLFHKGSYLQVIWKIHISLWIVAVITRKFPLWCLILWAWDSASYAMRSPTLLTVSLFSMYFCPSFIFGLFKSPCFRCVSNKTVYSWVLFWMAKRNFFSFTRWINPTHLYHYGWYIWSWMYHNLVQLCVPHLLFVLLF